jgi:hypothetical protein
MKPLHTHHNPLKGKTKRAASFRDFKGARRVMLLTKRH